MWCFAFQKKRPEPVSACSRPVGSRAFRPATAELARLDTGKGCAKHGRAVRRECERLQTRPEMPAADDEQGALAETTAARRNQQSPAGASRGDALLPRTTRSSRVGRPATHCGASAMRRMQERGGSRSRASGRSRLVHSDRPVMNWPDARNHAESGSHQPPARKLGSNRRQHDFQSRAAVSLEHVEQPGQYAADAERSPLTRGAAPCA